MELSPTQHTPRTEFWQESFDKKDIPKEKISEIFQKTIEYFQSNCEDKKSDSSSKS